VPGLPLKPALSLPSSFFLWSRALGRLRRRRPKREPVSRHCRVLPSGLPSPSGPHPLYPLRRRPNAGAWSQPTPRSPPTELSPPLPTPHRGEPPFLTASGAVRPQNGPSPFPSSAWCARRAPSSLVACAGHGAAVPRRHGCWCCSFAVPSSF
jgi:hypothetical protein